MGDFMFFLMVKIFLARIVDVSLNTVRTMFIVKGNKIWASLIAFFEILVWYYAVRVSINTNANVHLIAISYAFGYAAGTLLGTFMNDLFVTGIYTVNILSDSIKKKDIRYLRSKGYNISVINCCDDKSIINVTINKKKYKCFLQELKKLDSKCIIILNDAKIAYNGYK